MENEFSQMLRIPKERVAVLIGTNGKTRARIEIDTKTKLDITAEGSVEIEGESYAAWIARQIVKAIGRGFSPEKALLLVDDEFSYEIIELKDFANNENHMKRIKGRVIGTSGKTRDLIEELTQCYVSVYGKTISIIGRTEDIQVARRAVEMLLSGAKHSTVYRLLEDEHKKSVKRDLLGEG